ncbi:conserved hypothetical protein [Methylobacterium sp. 4-46]|uniref:hypothetical protein n=1 Tax=unclassified Methylobacterium TaxID=2615210 RepID=UPI000152C035|nr:MULTISPECIES: hypothetical protein [Methylobacterium]ACA19099.1 conserved hypothetical protein [Methylobacterium sp. 4-46]WFT78311.1 hypothetical protein QA634_23970 [Methylobacterium nodulans]
MPSRRKDPGRRRSAAGLAACLILGAAAPARAEPGRADHLDSEHLFGFTEGSDIGVPGEREVELETTGRLGRRGGRFWAFDPTLALKLPVSAQLRVAPGLSFAGYAVAPGPGLPAAIRGGLNGGFVETRLRLLDRDASPVGLTLSVTPSLGTRDGTDARPARAYGLDAALLADHEFVPGTLVGAVNLGLSLAWSRASGTGEILRGSGLDLSAALARRVSAGLFLGGELRYLRAFDGLALDRFAGEAVYLGPTLYAALGETAWIGLTLGVQVAGGAVGDGRPLDLAGFDRQQLRLRIGASF